VPAADEDAARGRRASGAVSRMAQSDAPHAKGAAGSCTRAAAVALRQLSRVFSCSQEEEGDDDVAAAVDAFFDSGTRWCCWYGAFLAVVETFWAMEWRLVPAPSGSVLGVSDDCCGDGGGFFFRLLPWWCRRLTEWSVAAALLLAEEDAEEEGSRRVASAMLKSPLLSSALLL
jgi:hypothetical protein